MTSAERAADVVTVPIWAVRNRWAIGADFDERLEIDLRRGHVRHTLVLRRREMKALVHGATLPLAPSEFLLLEHFATHSGQCCTVEELSRVLSVTRNPVSAVRVRLVVHRLRKELAPFGGNVILTLRGQGYRFQP